MLRGYALTCLNFICIVNCWPIFKLLCLRFGCNRCCLHLQISLINSYPDRKRYLLTVGGIFIAVILCQNYWAKLRSCTKIFDLCSSYFYSYVMRTSDAFLNWFNCFLGDFRPTEPTFYANAKERDIRKKAQHRQKMTLGQQLSHSFWWRRIYNHRTKWQ